MACLDCLVSLRGVFVSLRGVFVSLRGVSSRSAVSDFVFGSYVLNGKPKTKSDTPPPETVWGHYLHVHVWRTRTTRADPGFHCCDFAALADSSETIHLGPLEVNSMPRYFAHISQKGKIRYGEVPGSIGVLEAPDKPMPIGEAFCRTHDENGLAVGPCGSASRSCPAGG